MREREKKYIMLGITKHRYLQFWKQSVFACSNDKPVVVFLTKYFLLYLLVLLYNGFNI